jgi:hypothetical protein
MMAKVHAVLWMSALLFSSALCYGQAAPAAQRSGPDSVAQAITAGKPAIDPAKAADIHRLLELVGTRDLFEQSFGGSMTQIKPLVARSLPPGEYRDKLVDLFFQRFQAKVNSDEFMNLAVPVYDKYFTADEIKQLIKFYETPIGKKAVASLPKLTSELSQIGQAWGSELGRQSMNEVLAQNPDLAMAMDEARKTAK